MARKLARGMLPLLITLAGLVSIALSGRAAAQQGPDLAPLAGVYRDQHRLEMADGSRFTGENILEVEPLDPQSAPGTAYLRLELVFANAHSCSFWGMAEPEGPDSLVYRRPETAPGGRCVLRLRVTPDRLVLEDEGGDCRQWHCGARGVLDGIGFARGARRDIRYRDRLRASREFAEALAERAAAMPGR